MHSFTGGRSGKRINSPHHRQLHLLLMSLALAAFLPHCDSPAPSIQTETPPLDATQITVDFGTVGSYTQLQSTVTIQNTTAEAVELLPSQSSCHCVASITEGTHLEPGESLEVSVTFDPTGISGAKEENIFIRTVSEVQLAQITVIALVEDAVTLSPGVVHFDSLLGSLSSTQRIRFKSIQGEKFTLSDLQAPEYIRFKNRDPGQSSNEHLIEFSLDPTHPFPLGEHRSEATLKTSHPRHPEIHLAIIITKVPTLRADPGAIFIEGPATTSPYTFSLLVTRRDSAPFSIQSISDTDNAISFKFDPGPSPAHKIEATVQREDLHTPQSLLTITGNIGLGEQLEIPLTVLSP